MGHPLIGCRDKEAYKGDPYSFVVTKQYFRWLLQRTSIYCAIGV
jgi:hypothetical protein